MAQSVQAAEPAELYDPFGHLIACIQKPTHNKLRGALDQRDFKRRSIKKPAHFFLLEQHVCQEYLAKGAHKTRRAWTVTVLIHCSDIDGEVTHGTTTRAVFRCKYWFIGPGKASEGTRKADSGALTTFKL